jgi:hypothetical protein
MPRKKNLLDRILKLPAYEPSEDDLGCLEAPGREPLPVLVLPENQLPFSPELAYWTHLRAVQGKLVLMICYFALEHGPGSWAIPYARKPKDEFEALQQELKFTEGWENSFPACMIVITLTEGWRAALESVMKGGALGISVAHAKSLYPMRLQDSQLEELGLLLG